MATQDELTKRLELKFKEVPNLTPETIKGWLDDALAQEGYASSESVPTDKINALLLTAQISGVEELAINTAHYFNFSDGEESITKSNTSKNYLDILSVLKSKYQRLYGGDNAFRVMKRLDRL
ncbi:hypothetical protein ACRW9N_13465 [Listeria aquatica]|uniref:hypothetical protein n=1 Tax=Listeria aquatica TaxID=1494960 RepID=UPI003EF0A2C7